jgi:hypothetical protein
MDNVLENWEMQREHFYLFWPNIISDIFVPYLMSAHYLHQAESDKLSCMPLPDRQSGILFKTAYR